MHVGLIAPPWVPVPPVSYGGTEAVLNNLALGLRDLGHRVTLFSLGESTCPVPRRSYFAAAPADMGTSVEEAAHVLAAYDALADVDVIHDHTVLGPLLGAPQRHGRTPIVTTHHGAFTAANRRILGAASRYSDIVAISHDQAGRAGAVPITRVIHHGLDLRRFTPGRGDGRYLIFIGRMCEEKGPHRAIRIARRARRPLVLIAKMRDRSERDFFREEVEPLLDDDITVLFEPSFDVQLDLLQGAVALVNPIRWPEPFGLVMAEALAAGTPVLAFDQGAAREIISPGATGLLGASGPELADAVPEAERLDRTTCRRAALERFSRERMARDHVALYERLLAGHRPARSRLARVSPLPLDTAAAASGIGA